MSDMKMLIDLDAAFDAVTTRPELHSLISQLSKSGNYTDTFTILYIDEQIAAVRQRLGPLK